MEIVYYDEFFEWKNPEDLYRVCLIQQKEIKRKDKVINDLLKRITDLEFEVERLEKRVEQEKRIVDIKDKDIVRLYERIDKAIEYINEVLECNYHGANITFDVLIHNTNNILKGVDKD